jgi:hypothetical protein
VQKGSWPSTWKETRYRELGLDPAVWGKDKPWPDHIGYEPKGQTVVVRPESGFALVFIEKATGKEYIFKSTLNWDLIYDIPSGKWYYNRVDPNKEIDVSTLRVIPNP